MYCRNCGKEIPEGSKFCNSCGASQETETPSLSSPTNEPISTRQMRENNKKEKKQKQSQKKGCSVLAVCILAPVLLLLIIGAFSAKSGSSSNNTGEATTESTTEAPIEISAKELINEYQKNEIKANDMYKGKRLRVTGYVAEFSQSEEIVFSDSYYIYIDYGNAYDFNDISCYLNDSSVEKAIELKKGDKIVIEGNCTGFSFSNVKMSSCDIIS